MAATSHCATSTSEEITTGRYFESKVVAKNYAKYRPPYPDSIFAASINFLKEHETNTAKKFALAVDVACGPGHQSTIPLAEHFTSVLGLDVSEEQIAVAKKSRHPENVSFKVSAAEALPIEDGTVSFLQVATAAHWMDMEKFYKEVDRVLSPGGVVALFSYTGFLETGDHPNSDEINAILDEMVERPEKRGFYVAGNYMVIRCYTDDCLQIPYEDKIRINDIPQPVTATVEKFLGFFKTQSPFRRMEEGEPDLTAKWMEGVTDRLLKALGTTDLSSPFTYLQKIYMLLGRKPQSTLS